MKRKLSLFLLVVFLFFPFVSCSETMNNENNAVTEAETKEFIQKMSYPQSTLKKDDTIYRYTQRVKEVDYEDIADFFTQILDKQKAKYIYQQSDYPKGGFEGSWFGHTPKGEFFSVHVGPFIQEGIPTYVITLFYDPFISPALIKLVPIEQINEFHVANDLISFKFTTGNLDTMIPVVQSLIGEIGGQEIAQKRSSSFWFWTGTYGKDNAPLTYTLYMDDVFTREASIAFTSAHQQLFTHFLPEDALGIVHSFHSLRFYTHSPDEYLAYLKEFPQIHTIEATEEEVKTWNGYVIIDDIYYALVATLGEYSADPWDISISLKEMAVFPPFLSCLTSDSSYIWTSFSNFYSLTYETSFTKNEILEHIAQALEVEITAFEKSAIPPETMSYTLENYENGVLEILIMPSEHTDTEQAVHIWHYFYMYE